MRMRFNIALIGVLAYPTFAAADDELKTADEVITKYIEAIGGRAKMDAVKTTRATGKSIMGGGMETPMTMEQKRPKSMRVEFTFQGMTGIQAFDGESGWFVMPFAGKTDPEKMPEEMVKIFADQADMDGPLVDYAKKGHQIELVGKDEVEGSSTYKLKVTKKSGDVEYHYLDADHYLPVQLTGEREIQGMPIEFKVTFGDYKEVGGMMLPHSMTQSGGPMGGNQLIIEKYEVNVDLPDERFQMPAPKPKEETPPAGEAAPKEEKKPEKKDDGGK